MVNIRKATLADIDNLVTILVRSFDGDPIINNTVRQDSKRSHGFDIYFRTLLCRCDLPYGNVYTTKNYDGIISWLSPDQSNLGLFQKMSIAPNMIRAVGFRRLGRLIRLGKILERNHPKKKHYYLQVVGIDPEHQGKGIGTALMQTLLEQCDREGYGAYLENTNESNLAFYDRFGFAIAKKIVVEYRMPPLWAMWREPREIS